METTLSKRLRELRVENRKAQDEVRRDLKIKQTTFSNYENGTRIPPIGTLVQIARYYKVSTDYLLGNSDYKNPQHEQFQQQLNTLSQEALSGLSTLYSNKAIEVLDILLRNNQFAFLLEAFYAYYKGITGEEIFFSLGFIKGFHFSSDMDAIKRQYMNFVIGHFSELVLNYLDETREEEESE